MKICVWRFQCFKTQDCFLQFPKYKFAWRLLRTTSWYQCRGTSSVQPRFPRWLMTVASAATAWSLISHHQVLSALITHGPPSSILIEIWLYAVATCWPLVWPFCLSAVHKLSHPPTSRDFACLASQQGLGSHVVVVVVVVVVAVSFSFASRKWGNDWGRSQGTKKHKRQAVLLKIK